MFRFLCKSWYIPNILIIFITILIILMNTLYLFMQSDKLRATASLSPPS